MSHSLCQSLFLSSAFPWGPQLSAGQLTPNTPSLFFPPLSSPEPLERRWDKWMDIWPHYFISHSSRWLTSFSGNSIGSESLPLTVRPHQQTSTAICTADTTTESYTVVGHEKTTLCCMPEVKICQACCQNLINSYVVLCILRQQLCIKTQQ